CETNNRTLKGVYCCQGHASLDELFLFPFLMKEEIEKLVGLGTSGAKSLPNEVAQLADLVKEILDL
ncbi:hypothetical protein AMTR_s00064p00103790, partial [Amborella trichopoda]